MAVRPRISIFVPALLILLLATLYRSSHSHGTALEDRTVSTSGSVRSLLTNRRNNQIPDCSEMVSKSQCSPKAKCRWCRSDVLDDMCFSRVEAWRLPPQVFTCD